MQVFKFGGASVKNAAAIKNVGHILTQYQGEKIVVIVSAMGKMTNAFEGVAMAYYKQNGGLVKKFAAVKQFHHTVFEELFKGKDHPVLKKINAIFDTLEGYFKTPVRAPYHFIYDQIVSCGELLSTLLVSAYLNEQGIKNHWLDVRNCIKTDNTYREAKVNWKATNAQIQEKIPAILEIGDLVVTQGFLGSTPEFFTTTLGREGSDYTAAIFAYSLNASKMTVWKDVPGILTADPRYVKQTQKIDELSYYEAIEMSYYGAKVIHPKTIKPLQNKQIPLQVRSFVAPKEAGTTIHTKTQKVMPPVVVFNHNQIQLQIQTKDFSFIVEENLSLIYAAFAKHRIKTNLSQNGSISFYTLIDDVPYKTKPLLADLKKDFEVQVIDGLEMITLRHYTAEAVKRHTKGRIVLLTQKNAKNVHLVVR